MMEDLPFLCGWGWDFSLPLEDEFEGASSVILRLISFKLWNSSTARCPAVESLLLIFTAFYRSVALCVILRDSSLLVFLTVSFCDLGIELYTRDLVKFLRRPLFQDIFFKMAGLGLTPASEDVRSFTVLLSGSKDYIWLFTATELELRSCIALFETTGNLETCNFLR